ncbi:MAG: hypothetical protein WEF50_19290 [Myxococcota bacterium]
MTTKSPLIRRVGSGYSASWNGFYLYDEDLQRVLARVAELTRAAESDERGSGHASGKRQAKKPESAGEDRPTSE